MLIHEEGCLGINCLGGGAGSIHTEELSGHVGHQRKLMLVDFPPLEWVDILTRFGTGKKAIDWKQVREDTREKRNLHRREA